MSEPSTVILHVVFRVMEGYAEDLKLHHIKFHIVSGLLDFANDCTIGIHFWCNPDALGLKKVDLWTLSPPAD